MRWVIAAALGASLVVPALAAKYSEAQVAQLVEIAAAEKQPEAQRAKAIRELARTEVRTHLALLRRLLREERSLDIRLSAACTLAELGDRKAPRDLLLATAYDGERTPNCTRSDVLLALGRIGEPAAVLHLEKAIRAEAPADEPYYHQDVCRALGLLGGPQAGRVLLEALRDGSAPLRHAAITPLAGIANDRANPQRTTAAQTLILAARQDPDEKVAEQAASALLWMGVDGPAFFRLLETDLEPKVRARVARVANRHYLSPARLERLRNALKLETAPEVQAALQETLTSQGKPR